MNEIDVNYGIFREFEVTKCVRYFHHHSVSSIKIAVCIHVYVHVHVHVHVC